MPNNVISEINPTGEVGGEYKIKDSVARGLFFESEDDYEEAVSQGLLNDLPDGTMIYTPSTGGGGGGSTTVVEELSDIEAMTVFNGEAAGAKAVKTLKQAFSDALTALKNTAIAQAVGATGSTFTAVINKLAEIVNNGDTSKTITAGTSNKTSSIPAGYTSGGTITVSPTPSQTKSVTASRSDQTVTPDSGKLLSSVTVNAFPDASGTFNVTSSGTQDMGATNNYRYAKTNFPVLIGTYSSNTNINVSAYGATSASKFLAVCASTASATTSELKNSTWTKGTATYTAPSVSLSGSTLTVSVGKLYAATNPTNTSWSGSSTTINLSTKVYFIG